MAEILDLAGNKVTIDGDNGLTAVPDIVDALERMLARAREGEIRAVAIAFVLPGNCTSTMYAVAPSDPCSHELMAAICYLQHRYAAHKCDAAEEANAEDP